MAQPSRNALRGVFSLLLRSLKPLNLLKALGYHEGILMKVEMMISDAFCLHSTPRQS